MIRNPEFRSTIQSDSLIERQQLAERLAVTDLPVDENGIPTTTLSRVRTMLALSWYTNSDGVRYNSLIKYLNVQKITDQFYAAQESGDWVQLFDILDSFTKRLKNE